MEINKEGMKKGLGNKGCIRVCKKIRSKVFCNLNWFICKGRFQTMERFRSIDNW